MKTLSPNPPATAISRKIEGNGSFLVAYQLKGKHVLVIGGGKEAAIRTFFALDSSANVTVISPSPRHPAVQHRIDAGFMVGISRNFLDSDLDSRFIGLDQVENNDGHAVDMVLVCIDDHEESKRIAELARKKRIPVNCADIPELCDFYFMAQYREKDLQIAVSTNGAGPRLGARIRNDIVANLDPYTPDAVTNVGEIRKAIRRVDKVKSSDKEDDLKSRMGWISRFCDLWQMEELATLNDQAIVKPILDAFKNGDQPPLPQKNGNVKFKKTFSYLPAQLTSYWWCPSAMGYISWLRMIMAVLYGLLYQSSFLLYFHLKLLVEVLLSWTNYFPTIQKYFSSQKKNDGSNISNNRLSSTPINSVNNTKDYPLLDKGKYATIDDIASKTKGKGSLYLVGAGPGNPELLTLQASSILQAADLVVSDRLIPQDLLNLIEPSKLVLSSFKVGGASDKAQDESNDVCLKAVMEGKKVVRLKTGDPFVYGRGGEEILFFRNYAIDPIVIPGLTSAFAACSWNGIPVTHRGKADQVLILSGRGQGGSFPNIPPYDSMRTIIILMSLSRLRELSNLMMKNGYPADLPCVVIEKGTWSVGQQLCFSNLQNVAQKVNLGSPALFVVGQVCNLLHPL